VDQKTQSWRANARTLREANCEGDNEVFKTIRTQLQQLATKSIQRFKYLKNTPWSFSRTRTVQGAQEWIDQVMERPLSEHDSLTVLLWQRHEVHAKSRAAGNALDPLHQAAVERMVLAALDESAGEGYHGTTTVEKKTCACQWGCSLEASRPC